jgi:4-hydroxybenzoate polyprenyltransferase
MADVFAGFLLTHSTLQPADEVAALVVASAGLYTAGMVLNDLFDLEVDRRLRPERPLASGRITRAEATGLAIGLVIAAIAAALTAGMRTTVLAVFLLVSVVIYNGLVKASWAGPVVMGMCRLLNVLLGASTAAPDQPALKAMAPAFPLAAGMGTYIIGVTWFARREAEQSHRSSLIAAMVVMNLGLLIVALLATNPQAANVEAFWVVLTVPAVLVNRRLVQATTHPSPGPVQAAIKTAILALVILDASAVLLVRGPLWSLAVLALLVPTLLLGKWVYST